MARAEGKNLCGVVPSAKFGIRKPKAVGAI